MRNSIRPKPSQPSGSVAPPPAKPGERRLSRHFRGGKTLLILVAVLLLVLVVVAAPAFYARQITVTGQSRLDATAVTQASGLYQGQHLLRGLQLPWGLFTGRYKTAEQKILASSPYVKTARVRVSFPAGISIVITERQPAAYLKLEDSFVVLDEDGIVLGFTEAGETLDEAVPYIAGTSTSVAVLGQSIVSQSPAAVSRALTLIKAIQSSDRSNSYGVTLLGSITQVSSPEADNTYFSFRLQEDNILTVKLAEATTYADALNWLSYAIAQNKLQNLGQGVLDLTAEPYVFTKDESAASTTAESAAGTTAAATP
ncbi:MAG: FtsQ-type POTRA domain-containing protein [Oscillospiraceae bacterium]|nr:FtsQ-type POTRA domain-containing protein [Oscillospiraceae bacterium]